MTSNKSNGVVPEKSLVATIVSSCDPSFANSVTLSALTASSKRIPPLLTAMRSTIDNGNPSSLLVAPAPLLLSASDLLRADRIAAVLKKAIDFIAESDDVLMNESSEEGRGQRPKGTRFATNCFTIDGMNLLRFDVGNFTSTVSPHQHMDEDDSSNSSSTGTAVNSILIYKRRRAAAARKEALTGAGRAA